MSLESLTAVALHAGSPAEHPRRRRPQRAGAAGRAPISRRGATPRTARCARHAGRGVCAAAGGAAVSPRVPAESAPLLYSPPGSFVPRLPCTKCVRAVCCVLLVGGVGSRPGVTTSPHLVLQVLQRGHSWLFGL